MKGISVFALVMGTLGLAACAGDPMCGPGADLRTKCPGPTFEGAGGTSGFVPTGGFREGGKGGGTSTGGAGGSGVGAGGHGGGAGGTGGQVSGEYVDELGACRSDEDFFDVGCPPTFEEALGIERCAAPNCVGACGFQQVVETPCAPRLRCAYGASSGMLEGAVRLEREPTFCGGASESLVYGAACTDDVFAADPSCAL